MAGPIQPLLPDYPTLEEQQKRTKQAAVIGGLLIASRVAPQTMAPVMRFGFGIEIAAETGAVVGYTKLFPLNLAPFPFGFSDPKDLGLKPNYYLPPGSSGKYLPDFIPGIPEQRAEFAARQGAVDNAPSKRALAEAAARLASMTTPQLNQQLAGQRPFNYRFAGLTREQTNELTQAELNRRAAATTPPAPVAPVPSAPMIGPDFTSGRAPRPRPSVTQLETTSPASPAVEGYGPLVVNDLSTPQLLTELASTQQTLELILRPGLFTSQTELQRTLLNLQAIQSELSARARVTAPARIGPQFGPSVTPPGPAPGGPGPVALAQPQLPIGPQFGPSVSPSLGAPALGPSVSPSRPAIVPVPTTGPLVPSVSNTPGATQGQPNWPRASPDPSGTFPDKLFEHRHGDP